MKTVRIAVGLLLLAVGCPSPVPPEPTPQVVDFDIAASDFDHDQLFVYLTTGNTRPPDPPADIDWRYRSDWWFLNQPEQFSIMPGPPGREHEFVDKHLGLATHGRWVTVYGNTLANQTVRESMEQARTGGGALPDIEFPTGSILVKLNYGNKQFPADASVQLERADEPAVLTVIYKPAADVCAEPGRVPLRGEQGGCLGGGWRWLFYGLDSSQTGPDGKPLLPRHVMDAPESRVTQAFCINCHDPGARTDYLRGLERVSRELATTAFPTRDPAPAPAPKPDNALCERIVLGPELPADVPVDPASLPKDQRQALFDCWSWRSFVALNWPAGAERGQADTTRSITDAPKDGDVVWETYKATWELFQPDDPEWDPSRPGAPGHAWEAPRPLPKACAELESGPRPVITMLSKSSSREAQVANEVGQAMAGSFGTLADRNGELVRYEVLFNQTEFDDLLGAAATRGLTPTGPADRPDFRFSDGAMEVKASWKVLCTAQDDRARKAAGQPGCRPVDAPADYFARTVFIYEAERDSCREETLGLVGLHIARKTFWAPQWIWATFEHRSNVPEPGIDGAATGYSFHQPDCTPVNDDPATRVFQHCATQPFLAPVSKGDSCCVNAEINRFDAPGIGCSTTECPNNLTRMVPSGARDLNARYATALQGTPFANYMLVNTQWPMHGRRPARAGAAERFVNARLCPDQWELQTDPFLQPSMSSECYTMVPNVLRNASMESYMMGFVQAEGGVVQTSNRSCMGCHRSGVDFSYVFVDAVEQVVSYPP